MAQEREFTGIPIFCAEVVDRISGKQVFINFRVDHDIDVLESVCDLELDSNSTAKLNKIVSNIDWSDKKSTNPKLSPIYYTKDGKDDYVLIVVLNYEYGIKTIMTNHITRAHLIRSTLQEVERRYNSPDSIKLTGQFIGHKFDFDEDTLNLVTREQCEGKTPSPVNQKIKLVDEKTQESEIPNQGEDSVFDLYFRPSSRLLTCSVQTEKIPDSIAFNEDRIVIQQGEERIVDVYLPFFIDLSEPMKYKFDDRLGLFRAVFKVIESV